MTKVKNALKILFFIVFLLFLEIAPAT